MKQVEDKDLESARKRFIVSLIILVLAVIYLISPIDIIPDVIFPAGYIEDIPMLLSAAVYAGYSYHKMKKKQK